MAAKKDSGEAKDTLEVIDVAQLLARSVKTKRTTAADGDARESVGFAAPGPCQSTIQARNGDTSTMASPNSVIASPASPYRDRRRSA